MERIDWDAEVKRRQKEKEEQRKKDEAMSADELIEDYAIGIMRYIDDIEEIRKEEMGDDYEEPWQEEIDFETLYHSITDLIEPLSKKEDAEQALVKWSSHERWCVQILVEGASKLLEDGSFYMLDGTETEEELEELRLKKERGDWDEYDCYISWCSVRG